jgi:tetratricopeptide (TPR) repeat protein
VRSSNPLITLALAALVLAAPGRLRAQQKGQEFTQQGLLIWNFTPGKGADMKLGRKSADAVRDRMEHLVNKREVDVISGYDIRHRLELAGYSAESTLSISDVRALGRGMRADEYIVATTSKGPEGVRIAGNLVLTRNHRIAQPLPDAAGRDLDRAADQFAQAIAAARKQLVPLRRCENFMREGKYPQALAAAREGVAAYPKASLARTCLVLAMRSTRSLVPELLGVARETLELDPTNPYALEAMAVAYDSLHKKDEAADTWLRLAATDTADVDLVERIVYALSEAGSVRRAEPLILRAVAAYPDTLRLVRLKWRVLYELKKWPGAIEVGEHLLAVDSLAMNDSTFVWRLAVAYRSNEQPIRAVQMSAEGVTKFPGDARMYALYAQLVRGESDVVLARGLKLYPKNADLYAMNAKDLKAKGKLEEALAASKQAVALDSSLAQGQLVVAQNEFDLGRADSALVTAHRALLGAQDSALVAQFVLAKGNQLLRAANGSKKREDFEVAMRYLALADSLRSTPQTKFLLGASALSVTQQALSEAPKLPEKERSCALSRLGSETLPIARASLEAGAEVQPDAVKQYIAYLDQIAPFAEKQIAAFCT